ncbi:MULTISPECIES: hypothetical protein [Dyadobacter]|nr:MULTISPECIES: hypothetical protein [unclassified Dyadobacter]MCE7063477.1 hypothetical protein [Dyadobacter sp. CY343]
MKITTFAIKIWRWMSILFVVGALVWTYSLFPEMVAVDFANTGLAERYVSKEHIFYIIMGLFLLNNVVIAAFARHISNVDPMHLPIPNRKAWAQNRPELNEHLINWIYFLVAVINTIMGFSLFALATINSTQYKLDVFDFSWVYYAGIVLIVAVFLLPLRLLRPPVPEDKL